MPTLRRSAHPWLAALVGAAIALLVLLGPATPAAAESPRGAADTVERLYQAYFDRAPDPDGHAFWVGRLETDLTLIEIAEQFETSPEFVATYGRLDDRQFVELIYANVLDRTPDQPGIDYWTGVLAAGQSRAVVMTGFSESLEFVIAHSVDPEQIRRLYLAYFEREPDAAGLRFWVETNANGASLEAISASFALSNEFVSTYGDLDDAAFVRQVYTNVLGRVGDQRGFEFWLGKLTRREIDRGALMTAFSESPEFIHLTTPTRVPTTPTDPGPRPEPVDPDPPVDPPIVDRVPSCAVEVVVEQQAPTAVRLRMPTEDCLDLYPADATLVWNHGSTVEGNDVRVSGVPSQFFGGLVSLVHEGDSLFIGRFMVPNLSDPAAVSTDIDYRVNPVGSPTVEIGDVCGYDETEGSAFAVAFDPIDRRVSVSITASGHCDPLWLRSAVIEARLTLDGAPVTDPEQSVFWTGSQYDSSLILEMKLPAGAVGSDGLLDIGGEIVVTDVDDRLVGHAPVELIIPVNGANPPLADAPNAGPDVCVIDAADVDLRVSEGANDPYSLTDPAPSAAGTLHLQLPHGCGGESFPVRSSGFRSGLVVDLQLRTGEDRVFWGSPGYVDQVEGVDVYVNSDAVLAESVTAQGTVAVDGHIAFRTRDGELVALVSIDRVLEWPITYGVELSAPESVSEGTATFPLTVSVSSDAVDAERIGSIRLMGDTECDIVDPPVAGEPLTLYTGPLRNGLELTVDMTVGTDGCVPGVTLSGDGIVPALARSPYRVSRMPNPPTDVRIESSSCDVDRCSIVFSAVTGSALSPSIQVTGVADEEFSTYGTNGIWVYPVAAPPVGERLVFAPYETLPVATFCFHATGRPFGIEGSAFSPSIARCADLVGGSYVERAPTSEEIERWSLVAN